MHTAKEFKEDQEEKEAIYVLFSCIAEKDMKLDNVLLLFNWLNS